MAKGAKKAVTKDGKPKKAAVKAASTKTVKTESTKKVVRGRKQETVRERTQKAGGAKRGARIRSTASKVSAPIKNARTSGKKEFHLPLPDNKAGRVLSKRVRLVPRFLSEAWAEIRQVTWPDFKTTVKLTIAVFVFAVVFASIVGLLDFGLDKLFREVIVGNE